MFHSPPLNKMAGNFFFLNFELLGCELRLLCNPGGWGGGETAVYRRKGVKNIDAAIFLLLKLLKKIEIFRLPTI